MLKVIYSAAALLVIAVAAPAGQSARAAEHEHAEHFTKCAKVCADCQLQCDSNFKHCLTLLAEGKPEHAKTAQLCADCAECCKACSTLCHARTPARGVERGRASHLLVPTAISGFPRGAAGAA